MERALLSLFIMLVISFSGYPVLRATQEAPDQGRPVTDHSASSQAVSPGKGCMTLAVVTAPVDVVRLPKMERSVAFRETEVVHNCE